MADVNVRFRSVLVAAVLLLGAAIVAPVSASAAGATDVWIGSSQPGGGDGHSWTDANNWSTHQVPASGDSVVIAPPTESECYAHVDNVPTGVRLTNFTLREAVFQTTSTCLASVEGGSISVSGAFTWSAGDLETPTTLLSTSTSTITPTSSVPDTSRLGANLIVHGKLVLDGNVESAGSDQRLVVSPGASLAVSTDGEVDADDSNEIDGSSCCTNAPRVSNHGLLQVNGGRLDVSAVAFNQAGRLDTTDQGQVRTTHSANSSAAAGASYTGAGSWLVGTASTSTFRGAQNLGPDFHMILGGDSDSGDDNYVGTFSFAGTGTFDWNGGEISANLTIGHGINVVANGSVTSDDYRDLDGGPTTRLALINHGVITLSGGADYTATSGGKIANQSDGTISLGAGTDIDGGTISNHGTVEVPSDPSNTPVLLDAVTYTDLSGTTDIAPQQTLRLTGGPGNSLSSDTITGGGLLDLETSATITTTTTVAAGTTLQFGHGSLGGPSAAVVTVGGAGSFLWTGGSIETSLTLAPTGGVTVSGDTAKQIDERTPNKGGTVLITAPTTLAQGSSSSTPNEIDIRCGCHLTLAGPTTAGGDVVIDHGITTTTGSLDVYAGAGHPTYFSATGYTSAGTTTVHSGVLQSDDDFVISSGTVNVAAATASVGVIGSSSSVRLVGGTLTGIGHVTGPVVNSGGTVTPGGAGVVAALYVDGSYSQAQAATLGADIASTRSDRLVVAGTATLAGTVQAHNVGTYSPQAGATATIVTSKQSVTGTLSCVVTSGTNATGAGARHWSGQPSGTSLVLTSLDGEKTSC